ncbi:MAG TPA: presenilin family intramembrane aspartyl protease [Candidatus Saccharimonadales bacterium]|nr:presenilin family intramembrane aspartyl protease [Candidatus Saccharimonadales bacterium]
MQRVLFAWLPLLVAVLLLLRWYASALGPLPIKSETGESKLLERSAVSRRSMATTIAIVAVGMSIVLALMVLVLSLDIDPDGDGKVAMPSWLAYTIYGVAGLAGAVFLASQVYMLSRLFKPMWAKVAIGVYAVATAVAWVLWPNWLTIDLLAVVWVLVGLSSYVQITLNFKAVAVIGAGLFIYDIVNVYFTGNMQRAAEPMLEAELPALVVVPQSFDLDAPRAAALGLGDITVPGLLIMLAAVVAYRHNAMRVLYGGLAGYAVGLILIFGVLFVTKHPQPALITLYPCVLIAIILVAKREGVLGELLSLRHKAPPKAECTCGKHHKAATA